MNEIFNLKRYCRYSRLCYTEKFVGLVPALFACALLMPLLMCPGLKSSVIDSYYSLQAAHEAITQKFMIAFFMTGFALTLQHSRVWMSGLKGSRFSMQDMLIPVSTTERYIFGLLNSVVVTPTLYILIFWGVSSFVESLYYFPTDGVTTSIIFKGIIDFNPIQIPAGYEQIDIFNFATIKDMFMIGIDESASSIPILAALYLFGVSILMWGEVTFAKNGVIIASAIHIGILALVGFIVARVAFTNFENLFGKHDLDLTHSFSVTINDSIRTLIYIIIPTIIYQVVIFMKIKNLSIKK